MLSDGTTSDDTPELNDPVTGANIDSLQPAVAKLNR